MTLDKSPEITQTTQSDTPKPTLTNLRVTTQARDDANYIADALGMEQRATVERLLHTVRAFVETEREKNIPLAQFRRAVLGGNE